MDQGLFKKYSSQIKYNNDVKEQIIAHIFKKTNITIDQKELHISKKIITIQTTSVKRTFLIQKNIKELLQELGYTVNL